MALRTLRIEGDPILTETCREVKEITPKIAQLIEDMEDTMYSENGVGLAAPQVGVLRKIVVIDVGDGLQVLVNPQIIKKEGTQTGDEGCLSVPGKVGTVTRPNHVEVEAYDEHMNKRIISGDELMARAICHELDHLDGKLFTELVEGDLRDVEYDEPEEEE